MILAIRTCKICIFQILKPPTWWCLHSKIGSILLGDADMFIATPSHPFQSLSENRKIMFLTTFASRHGSFLLHSHIIFPM